MTSFDEVSQRWLIRFVEHRVGDPRIIRLIQKWLKAGVLEDGIVTVSDKGTGQGSVISPLLANLYLHYAFDLWAERWRRREAAGNMIIVRYADDWLPKPRILHPWPESRFAVRHPRWEPYARIGPVRICAGGAR